jgi:hypothetical protein
MKPRFAMVCRYFRAASIRVPTRRRRRLDRADAPSTATDTYEDLVGAGVIDPTKVTRTALQNAASIASLMLTTEAMIAAIPEKKSSPGGPGAHGPEMDY